MFLNVGLGREDDDFPQNRTLIRDVVLISMKASSSTSKHGASNCLNLFRIKQVWNTTKYLMS